MPASADDLPLVGTVVQISRQALTVANHDGRQVTVALDEQTFCRWLTGERLSLDEVASRLSPGAPVMAGVRDGRATLLRLPR